MAWACSAACAAFAIAVLLGSQVERSLVVAPVDGAQLYGGVEDGSAESATSNGATQRLRQAGDRLSAVYSFRNFVNDRVTVEFSLSKEVFRKYDESFGYYKKDLAGIDEWLNTARQGAYKYAVASHKSQAQLNAALAGLDRERQRKIDEYMSSHGFRILPGRVVSVDVPGVVKKNAPILNSVARAIDQIASQQGYDSSGIIGTGASLVQTAMIYRQPPAVEPDGKHNGGILPPASALLKGWGDCDTKTALLASILANWPQNRMVGVALPGHYLMAVLRIPDKGDAFVEYNGLQYVLIEPAGPAWLPPGRVADSTVALLESSDGQRIDPLYQEQ
jgi:hypothetical protein